MKSKSKILSENYTPSYTSVTLLHNVDGIQRRFKIWTSNGNSYKHSGIDIQTVNLDYKTLYTGADVPGYAFNSWYGDTDNLRIYAGKAATETLINFLDTVF